MLSKRGIMKGSILLVYLLFLSVLFLGVVSAECGDGTCDANECKTAVSGKIECSQDCQYQCSDGCDNDDNDLIDTFTELDLDNGQEITIGVKSDGLWDPELVVSTLNEYITQRNLPYSQINYPLVRNIGNTWPGGKKNHCSDGNCDRWGKHYDESKPGVDDITLTKACNILGYKDVKSSECLDEERSGTYSNGKCNFHSPENNFHNKFSKKDNNFVKESAMGHSTKYAKTWVSKLTCVNKFSACNDNIDNDGDDKMDILVEDSNLEGLWIEAWNQGCVAACNSQGMDSKTDAKGNACTSGETRGRDAVVELGAGIYEQGCWDADCGRGYDARNTVSSSRYCYASGQKQDRDATDITAACYCERRKTICDDGIDNDGDEKKDYPEDEGCASVNDISEIEHDPGCTSINDDSEYLADPQCDSPEDDIEGPACEPAQIIMKLETEGNSLGALWNDANYKVDICYDEIFGEEYVGDDPHSCDEDNKVLGLEKINEALAETADSDIYSVDVCYGDLRCRSINTSDSNAGSCDGPGEKIVANLSAATGARISKGDDTNFPIKICCKLEVTQLESAYWAYMNDEIIESIDSAGEDVIIGLKDKVKLVVEGKEFKDKNINYEIFKKCSGFVGCTDAFFTGDDVVAQTTVKGEFIWDAGKKLDDDTYTFSEGKYYFSAKIGELEVFSSENSDGSENLNGILTVGPEDNDPPVAKIKFP